MRRQLASLLWVGGGAFLGANARFLLSGWVARWCGPDLPWGTFLINVTGSFALGLLATLAGERYLVAPGLRMMLTIGFLGSYTTFSTWTYETLALAEAGSFIRAAGNALGSLAVGLVAVWLGSRLARWT